MIPYAKLFVETATPAEIIALCDLLFKDGNYSEGGTGTKIISLTAMGVIAGFTPNVKVKAILAFEIDSPGEHEGSTYSFLYGRYKLIRDLLFLPIIEKEKYLNRTHVRLALEHYKNLRFIAQLPYANLIGIEIPSLWFSEYVDTTEYVSLGRRAKTRFLSKLKPAELSMPEIQAMLKEFDS